MRERKKMSREKYVRNIIDFEGCLLSQKIRESILWILSPLVWLGRERKKKTFTFAINDLFTFFYWSILTYPQELCGYDSSVFFLIYTTNKFFKSHIFSSEHFSCERIFTTMVVPDTRYSP